jgi:hypothetical protein
MQSDTPENVMAVLAETGEGCHGCGRPAEKSPGGWRWGHRFS